MPRLFTYTIPIDDGAAPNPFGGICTLAICKPGIRRVAQRGDWVAGLGSKKAPSGDLSGRLVYAMRIEDVLTMQQYDSQSKSQWPHRIPDMESRALQDRLGDCIYDYSVGADPVQRAGVHGLGNVDTDLGGKNVLISTDFYYFGRQAIELPSHLKAICHQTQGHRSNSNARYFDQFVEWLRSLLLVPGQLYGWPDHMVEWDKVSTCGGCPPRITENQNDIGC